MDALFPRRAPQPSALLMSRANVIRLQTSGARDSPTCLGLPLALTRTPSSPNTCSVLALCHHGRQLPIQQGFTALRSLQARAEGCWVTGLCCKPPQMLAFFLTVLALGESLDLSVLQSPCIKQGLHWRPGKT